MSEGQAAAHKDGLPRPRAEEPKPDPLIGRVVADRFKITSLIARGGMGKVYRAEQQPLGRLCAIKVLNPNYSGDADPEFHRRFFREASIASRITHPNSVTIFDYGKTDDDIYFMAMEYLEGQTLHMALRDIGVMHEYRAGRIAGQICRALREAHKLGVIHRDLKPANIFLTRANGRHPDRSGAAPPPSEDDEDFVKVLDFGLVKHLAERPEEQLTQTGLFMGSPKYMAPEQIQGGNVDERTDIYSLGIILYEMVCGKVPFERASSVNILMAHVSEPPPLMRQLNPGVMCSPAFEELIMCCISKDPNARFGSMDQLLQAIRRAHGGSVTGQVAAFNATGPYTPPTGNFALPRRPSQPPPPHPNVYTPPYGNAPPPHRPSGAFVSASASHTPAGIIRGQSSTEVTTAAVEKPRSKVWIAAGVLVAAVLGGGLGMLAFRMTTQRGDAPKAAATAAPTVSSAPAPATSPAASVAAEPAAPEKQATIKVVTEPPGSIVREEGKELCSPTPCTAVFKGDAADPGKAHRLVVSQKGFKPEVRNVKPGQTVHVKLAHPPPKASAKVEGAPSGAQDPPN